MSQTAGSRRKIVGISRASAKHCFRFGHMQAQGKTGFCGESCGFRQQAGRRPKTVSTPGKQSHSALRR
jgi:hypothetical protein